MSATGKLQRSPVTAYFPEAVGVHTDLNLSLFFRIMQLAAADGSVGLLLSKIGPNTEVWLPELFWRHVGTLSSAATWDAKIEVRPFTTVDGSRYVHLSAEDLIRRFFTSVEACGLVPQLSEICEINKWSVWTTSVTANRLKEFIVESGLYLRDRSTRIILISQHCQCRGKS